MAIGRTNATGGGQSDNPTAWLSFNSESSFTIQAQSSSGLLWSPYIGVMKYSLDGGGTWNEWAGGSNILTAGLHNGRYKVYLAGKGFTKVGGGTAKRFVINGTNVRCDGYIDALLDWQKFVNGETITLAASGLFGLFYNCSAIITAPDFSKNLILTNNKVCREMFSRCSNLEQPPRLPAEVLGNEVYFQMFNNCSKLKYTPELPATTFGSSCYYRMFIGCSKIKTPPELPATVLTVSCYEAMFSNCTSLITLPKLPAVNLATGCYTSMFSGCTKIKKAATQGGEYQYEYRIPESGTGSDASTAMSGMFSGTGGDTTDPVINTTYYLANIV